MRPLIQERASGADSRNTRVERIDAVIICSDDALLIELGPLLGDRFRTHTVDSAADIASAVPATRWIGILDVESLSDARPTISRLEIQYPRCPLVLIVPRPAEWSALVARGAAVAAVSRQEAAGPRLLEALAGAQSRLQADVEPQSTADYPSPGAGPDAVGARSRSSARWMAAVALAGVAVGSGWWMLHRGHGPAGSRSVPAAASTADSTGAAATGTDSAAAAASPAVKPQSVLELLSAARVAFRDQKLLLPRPDGEPRGDSALELYAQVISQDPDNDEALDGVRRLFEVGKARIQGDIGAGKLDDASRLVGLFRDAGVGGSDIATLTSAIAAAKPRWLELRVQQSIEAGDLKGADQLLGQLTASGADPGAVAQLRRTLDARAIDLQLTALATQMRTAIGAGHLLEPAPDDARSHLMAMRTLSRTSSLTLAAQRELQSALLAQASDAVHAGQLDTAQRLLTASSELGTSAATSEVRHQLQAALAAAAHPHAAAPKPVVATLSAPPAAAPPPPAALAPPPPAYIAAHPTRGLSLSYPPGQTAQGYVIVEFSLQPDGSARDVSVVQSTLPAVFSRVAIGAVAHGRYDTRDLTQGQPMRARLRLRFQPDAS